MEKEILMLQKRTIEFLEKTKKMISEFLDERKKLDEFLKKSCTEQDFDSTEWKTYLEKTEQKVSKIKIYKIDK